MPETVAGARVTKQADQDLQAWEHSLAQRIILADTQAIFRTGAARVLAMEEDMQVVAQCSDLPRLREAIGMLRDAIVVFPTSMTQNIPDVLHSIEASRSKSVIIVEHGDKLDAMIAERVNGVVLRSVAGSQLVDCLRRVAIGERCIQQVQLKKQSSTDRVGARVLERLTPKELQIVALVTEGGKNKEIAVQLGTKEQVIKNYLRNIYDKTGVSDRLELAVFTQHHRTLADAAMRVREELQSQVQLLSA
jgi:DNA-binding NarL/FixJ family response regulator